MKTRLFTVLIILAIGLAGFTRPAQAQAYSTAFTTSITYQNVGTAATTTLQILFYDSPTQTTPIIITQPTIGNLAAGAGTSVSIGNLGSILPGFQGSAVMQADQPLLATLVQVPQGGVVLVRPLSNGFAAGAPLSMLATVLKHQFSTNTIFSVQNVDSEDNNINIKFYNINGTFAYEYNPAPYLQTPVESGAAMYWDAGAVGDPLPDPFNGSAVVSATRLDGSAGAIISSAMELDIITNGAKAFEGIATGATKIYMPSALCDYNIGAGLTNTSYAVQNTGAVATDVTVTYSPGGASQTKTVQPGSKQSFVACQAAGIATNFLGAATVTSTTTPVIAVGKAYGAGLSTAFVGVADGNGSAKIALPYVRYANDTNWNNSTQQRVFITIQNIGAAPITADVVVQYVTCLGAIAGTHTITDDIAVGAKKNSNASLAGLAQFGLCGGGGPQFGGSVLITTTEPGAQLAVVARVQTLSGGLVWSEDYNGLNTP